MEKSINKVELSGFTGKDPQMFNLSNGSKMVRFTLATSTSYKNKNEEWQRETTWHNISMWDKLAEKAATEIKKGAFVKLTGKIVNREYTDKNGVKHNASDIRAFEFEIIKIEKKAEAEKAA